MRSCRKRPISVPPAAPPSLDRKTTIQPVAKPTALDCPQCGGSNALASGEALLHCQYCDAALFVDRAGLVLHFRLPRLLDQEAARAALHRWMSGTTTVKNLDRKATDLTLEPLSFPVWMFRHGGDGTGEVVRIEPAAPTPIAELADLRIPAGELEPYVTRDDEIAVPASVPIETARSWLGERAAQVTETALVHLPLWRCRYRYEGEGYSALVDGSTGTVLASLFPTKAESPYVLTAAAGLILFGLLGFAIQNPVLKLLAYGVASVPLLLTAYWVSRKV